MSEAPSRYLVLDGDRIAHVEDHGGGILGGRHGVEGRIALQTEEIVGVSVQDRRADSPRPRR